LTTPATYSFYGFPDEPEHHFYLSNDGYPAGAAWQFAAALQICTQLSDFPTCFVKTEPRRLAQSGPDAAADAEYHYRVEFKDRPIAVLQVQAWHRLPESGRWTPRCEVMPMEAFLKRFLPDPDQCRSASR
jgi:hypothetical protein